MSQGNDVDDKHMSQGNDVDYKHMSQGNKEKAMMNAVTQNKS